MKRYLIALITLALASTATFASAAPSITGAGSSFIYPLMARWTAAYYKQTNTAINYQSIGSGGGIEQLASHTVSFAAVDMPQSPKMLAKHHWLQFPAIVGGIVVTINLPGVANNQLQLDGPTLAKIFAGKITHWNNPAIVKLNPHLKLPAQTITVVHRADGSGTTYNFTHYLGQVSPQWQSKIGFGTTVAWPVGIGAKGNSGVAMFAERAPGSIAYVGYSYAKQNDLTMIKLQNKAGHFVSANTLTFAAAAKNAQWQHVQDYQLLLTDQPGAQSWPIDATTFALVPQAKNATTSAIKTFFTWSFAHGQLAAKKLDYIMLPQAVIQGIAHYWQEKH